MLSGQLKNSAGMCLQRLIHDIKRESSIFMAPCYWSDSWTYDSSSGTIGLRSSGLDTCLDCGALTPAYTGDFPVYSNVNCPRDGSRASQVWRIETVADLAR